MNLSFKLEDFFPYYIFQTLNTNTNLYNLPSDPFYNQILIKKEFNELELDPIEALPKDGGYFKHQNFMARLLSPNTPYDRMLVFHHMGTGKSCTIASVAEYAKLHNPNIKEAIVLVSNRTLEKNLRNEIATTCTNNKYYVDRDEKGKKLSQETIQLRTNKAISKNYDIRTYYNFAKEIYLLSDDTIRRTYSNRLIMIDEAHNLKFKMSKPKDQKEKSQRSEINVYNILHRFLHIAKDCKILLLTATPMRDQPREICSLMNLLLPMNNQLDVSNFKNFFKNEQLTEEAIQILKSSFKNVVSYVRSMTNIDVNYVGQIHNESNDPEIQMKYIKVESQTMDKFQLEIYSKAY